MESGENAFGQELRRLRKDLNMKQVDLAKLAGVSNAYVSQLETGFKRPTDRVIAKLCKAIDIPENRLLLTIGKIKMDLASTLAIGRNDMPKVISSLSDEQFNELSTFISYMKIKASFE